MSYQYIETQEIGGVLVITMDDARTRNAIGDERGADRRVGVWPVVEVRGFPLGSERRASGTEGGDGHHLYAVLVFEAVAGGGDDY